MLELYATINKRLALPQRTHVDWKDGKGWKKTFHANGNQQRAGRAIFISDKVDFKSKSVKRDKGRH